MNKRQLELKEQINNLYSKKNGKFLVANLLEKVNNKLIYEDLNEDEVAEITKDIKINPDGEAIISDGTPEVSIASELISTLKIGSANLKVLHRHLSGGNWFDVHELLASYYAKIDEFEDAVIENLIPLGVSDITIADATHIYSVIYPIRSYSETEALDLTRKLFLRLITLFEETKSQLELPDKVKTVFDDMENWLHIEGEYKLAHYFGKSE